MYTYAFFKLSEAPLTLPPGIEGPVEIVSQDSLAALVEPGLSIDTLQTDEARLIQAVLDHDRVIQQVFQQTPVLPLRLGTQFVSLEALQTHLTTHKTSYLRTLARLAGKAEYTLKFIPGVLPETPLPTQLKGKDYFLAKKQQYQAQVEQQAQQTNELQTVFLAITQAYPILRVEPTQDPVQRLHLLIDQSQAIALSERLLTWQTQCPHWQIQLGEPLPPYHFVE